MIILRLSWLAANITALTIDALQRAVLVLRCPAPTKLPSSKAIAEGCDWLSTIGA
jgi:hypothetical protein